LVIVISTESRPKISKPARRFTIRINEAFDV